MEPNIQNSSGMMNGMPPEPKQTKKVGPIIGALVIVLIIIIAALYIFGKRLNTTAPASMQNTTENTASLSSSTDTQDINADLDAQLKDVDYSF